VRVAGVDRMVLTDQLAVMDLMALGDFLLLPEDDLTLATLLKSPLFGFDDEDLFELAHGRGAETLWRRLGEKAAEEIRFAEVRARLGELLARVDFLPPYELYADILGTGRGRRLLVARLGPEANDPIDEFLALALHYGQLGAPSLQGFLHWLRAGEGEIKRDLEQSLRDEVRIITVHGAKGLQAPIVFLPDTMQTPRHDGPALLWSGEGEAALPVWIPAARFETPALAPLRQAQKDRRLEEYRRLLYVALTRAEDRLYVAGWHGRRKPPEGCWYHLVVEALGPLATSVPLDSADTGHDWEAPALRIDNRQTAKPSQGKDARPEREDAALPDWALTAAPGVSARPSLAPSRPDEQEPGPLSPLAGGDGRRFQRGLLIHRLLQSLPDLAPAERAAAAGRYLASPAHELSPAAQREIASVVEGVLADPAFAVLFQPGSLAEVAVGGMVGERMVQGQIDRLAVTAEAVWIVDFKSQRPPPLTAAGVPAVYLRQMAAYRALVARIYGDRPVRCALLWTEAPRLMALDDDLLDRHAI
jgi:ATP-dependent helicase/nuclease subunit A